MRLFIASFAKLDSYEKLKQQCSHLNLAWMREEKLHLTYAFFPNEKDPSTLLKGLKELPLEQKDMEVQGLGCFGKKILYAKVEDEILYKNYELIRSRFGGEVQSFEPHVTLARIKEYDDNLYKELLSQNRTQHLGRLSLEIVLVQSTLTDQGSIYKTVAFL